MGFNLGDDHMGGFNMGADSSLFLGDSFGGPTPHGVPRIAQPTQQTQVLPFPQGASGAANVGAGASATVAARPQRVFQTQRFVWSSVSAPFFSITGFTIGQENMFVQAGAVPAEVFSQTGVGVSLMGYIARPGIDISLSVINNDANAHTIDAAIIGAAMT